MVGENSSDPVEFALKGNIGTRIEVDHHRLDPVEHRVEELVVPDEGGERLIQLGCVAADDPEGFIGLTDMVAS